MYRKLTDDVSIQEMLQMRQQGMTNKQIADALDISKPSVYKYIGKQPDGLRAHYGSISAHVTDAPEKRPSAQEKRTITVAEQYRKTVYAGKEFDYTVLSTGQIKIEKRGQGQHLPEYRETINLTMDAIPGLMQELMDIVYLTREAAT